MYLHAGDSTVINTSTILGIFDTDTSTMSSVTRRLLTHHEKSGEIVYTTNEIPKSFILTSDGGVTRLYMVRLSAKILKKRIEQGLTL